MTTSEEFKTLAGTVLDEAVGVVRDARENKLPELVAEGARILGEAADRADASLDKAESFLLDWKAKLLAS